MFLNKFLFKKKKEKKKVKNHDQKVLLEYKQRTLNKRSKAITNRNQNIDENI